MHSDFSLKIIEKCGSSLGLGIFSIQLTPLDTMEYLDLTIVKERRRTESALCAISGETFGKESMITTLVPKKPVSLSVGRINIDSVGDKNSNSPYKIYNTNEDVSFC